jgi:hypothetical protein
MTNLDYDNFQEDVFKSIVKDYGRMILKQIQQTSNIRLVKETLSICLKQQDTIEYSAKKLIRIVTQKLV